MKLNINIRIFFSLLTLLFLMTVFNISVADATSKPTRTQTKASKTQCTGNAIKLITQPGTTNCEFEPDEFKMTFTRLELCTGAPTPPGPQVAVGRDSCSTLVFVCHTSAVEGNTVVSLLVAIAVVADEDVLLLVFHPPP